MDWAGADIHARPIREAVFLREQGVPEDMEWDAFDAVSRHALAFDDSGRPIATGRLLPDGHIGRMAVLQDWRGQGLGSAVLASLLAEAARLGYPALMLHAQTHAAPFYARFGFRPQGPEFMEAGIPHVLMARKTPRYGEALQPMQYTSSLLPSRSRK